MPRVVVCEFCDLPHALPVLGVGERAHCARCRGALASSSRDPIDRTLALALAAAVLLVLANLFPFLRMSLEGQVSENTIATGVFGLWRGGQPLVAALVLFTTILAPALRISVLLYVVIPLRLGRVPPGVAIAVRFQEALVSWAMLDVYMLAFLVALVKVSQMARVELELGAFCFVALFVVLAMLGSSYEREALWQRVEELR